MPFKPQTKRFALVPVEPGKEKDTDVRLDQEENGWLYLAFVDESSHLSLDYPNDRAIIAALGFPTEGEEA